MQNTSPEPRRNRWYSDVVTWAIILLVAVTILLLSIIFWPHGFDPLER